MESTEGSRFSPAAVGLFVLPTSDSGDYFPKVESACRRNLQRSPGERLLPRRLASLQRAAGGLQTDKTRCFMSGSVLNAC